MAGRTPIPSIVDENGVTVNGLRLTDKLDVAFYIKGDAKATQLYDVRLVLEYEVASTLTVTNTADAGVGSLRAALLAANLNPGLGLHQLCDCRSGNSDDHSADCLANID